MAQFTTEAATFTLLGLVVGAVVGIIAASPATSALVSHSGASSATGGAGQVVVSVYSSGAIGRLVPEDVIGLVRYLRQHTTA
jgi:hypothetical protein